MIRKQCPIFFAMALFVFAGGERAIAQEGLKIAGDPCSAPLARKLGEAFTKKTGVTVTVEQGPCRSGVASVIDGKTDLGVSTFNFGKGQLHEGVTETVIGKAPIVLVLNNANPVESLTRAQVHDIFVGKIRNWKEVGGKDMQIKNVMLPPCVVETMTHQMETYGAGPNLSKLVKEGNPMTNTNLLVAENEGAIGMQLYGYEDSTVKVMRIDGALPAGDAPLSRYGYFENYNIISGKTPSPAALKFIEFAKSGDAKAIMVAMKHVPEGAER